MAEDVKAEFKAHERTYDRFIVLFKYGTIAAFVIAFIVVLIIS